jgi:hypothetical protein
MKRAKRTKKPKYIAVDRAYETDFTAYVYGYWRRGVLYITKVRYRKPRPQRVGPGRKGEAT